MSVTELDCVPNTLYFWANTNRYVQTQLKVVFRVWQKDDGRDNLKMNRNFDVRLAASLLFCLGSALGQVDTGAISGIVRDHGGALAPGAAVVITNTGTGYQLKTVTNADGLYVSPPLPTGPYRVDVALAGFRSAAKELRLNIGEHPSVDFTLELGTVTESVLVQALLRLGLHPDRPTGLVLFGGEGSMDLVKVARALNRPDLPVQLIVICGRHQRAEAALRQLPRSMPMFIEGFTRDLPQYMALADFFIGKPGPGSMSEALHMGLPVIVERNAWTLAQERYNTEWIEEQKLGLVIRDFAHLAAAVRVLLQPGRLAEFRTRALALNNRAIFEIPEMLETILSANRDAGGASAESKAAFTL